MAIGAIPRWFEHGQDLVLKAAELAVHDVQGHLDRGPRVGLVEHLQMDRRVLVAGEAQEADLPLLLGLEGVFDRTPCGEDPVGVVVVDDLVELPEVEMIGAEPAQAVFQVRLGVLGGPAAALGHEEDLVAAVPLRDRLAHALFGAAVVIVPGVVEEGDSLVDRPLDQADAVVFVWMDAAVVASQADHRDGLAGSSERPQGNSRGVLAASRIRPPARGKRGRRQTGGARLDEFATARAGASERSG